jgi:hypothetical protein
MIPIQRIKNQHKNLTEVISNLFLTEDKTKLFIGVDLFIKLIWKDVCQHVLNNHDPIHRHNRKINITTNSQKEYLKTWGFAPMIGSFEENQRLMIMSDYYCYSFKVTNKNKLRSFLAKKIK